MITILSCEQGNRERREPSERNTYADIEVAYKYLEENYGVKQEDIILYGQSVGSGPTIDLASRLPRLSLCLFPRKYCWCRQKRRGGLCLFRRMCEERKARKCGRHVQVDLRSTPEKGGESRGKPRQLWKKDESALVHVEKSFPCCLYMHAQRNHMQTALHAQRNHM
ncbi:hypothetical protein Fmac_021539 [Flemingia macrophylla]|uniref:Uncharacterized protein n=1 Tax=Flemingia macrophylla TaxID=520843 RepID=A0ABD1LXE3_9FABA